MIRRAGNPRQTMTFCGILPDALSAYSLRQRPPVGLHIGDMFGIRARKPVVALVVTHKKQIIGLGWMHRRLQ